MGSFTLKCPNCGGTTVLNPETGKLECTQCGQQVGTNPWEGKNSAMVEAEDGSLVDKRSYKAVKRSARIKRYITDNTDSLYDMDEINLGMDEDSPEYMEMNLYECTSCGARLMVKTTETSSFCAYCGQPMILIDRVTDELKPDLIIPFGVSQKRAEQLIRDRFCKGWFVPGEIKNFKVDKIRGIYIPYWLMTYRVKKKIKYEYYEEKDRGRTNYHGGLIGALIGQTEEKEEETVKHCCMRDAECTVSRIPGDASRRLNDNISSRLEPYDMDGSLEFSPEYLSGFYTDRYDVPAKEIEPAARRKSDKALRDEMLSDGILMGNKKDLHITDEKTDIEITDIEYALLPAWFMTFHYKGIMYTVAVNGQTGKVVGNVPSDRFRVGSAISILLVLLTVLCTYASVFMGNLISVADKIESGAAVYAISAHGFLVCSCVIYFWRAVNKLHRSRIDIHRFRSTGVIAYIKERQDNTWVR